MWPFATVQPQSSFVPIIFCQMFIGFAALLVAVPIAHAQFGMKCDAPNFEILLKGGNFSAGIESAIRAKCLFNKKNAEIVSNFGKPGWSYDLLQMARVELAELNSLANKAAEINFKTGDPRALGNIRDMYVRLGNLQRWLAENEVKDAVRKKNAAAASQIPPSASADPGQNVVSTIYVSVIFQQSISEADRSAFLDAYHVTIADGPDVNLAYRLRFSVPVPHDQLQLVLDSMNSQSSVIKSASSQ